MLAEKGFRLRRRQRIFFGRAQRRYLSLPPVCGGKGFSDGQRVRGQAKPRNKGKVRLELSVYARGVRRLLCEVHLQRRLQCEQLSFYGRYEHSLQGDVRYDEEAHRVRNARSGAKKIA